MIKSFLGRIVVLVIAVILIIILLNQIGLFSSQVDSYPAEIKLLKNEFETQAVIFRNEVLLSAQQAGKVDFLIEDGQRVPQGTVIATVTPVATDQSYQPFELKPEWLVDMELIEQEYSSAQDQLAYSVKENRLAEVDQVKEQLEQLLVVRSAYQKNGGFLPQESALATKTTIGGKIEVQAPHGGIVAYTVAEDDLLFHPFNIPLIDYDKYPVRQNGQIIRQVLANQPFIRLVQNRESYLSIRCDETTMKQFTVGRRVSVIINGQEIRPVVTEIFKANQDYGIILTVLEEFTNDYNDRTTNVTVISQQLEGLAIKTSSFVEMDNVLGVYVLKKGYRSVFVPVQVLGTFGDEAIIASDNFLTMEGNQTIITQTVNLYDEIVEDPQE